MPKLNKNQLKKLYDYGDILSPTDWATMIDNMAFEAEYDNSGTIVKTTYEEAKYLYESGQMIPGVYYEFPYVTEFDLSYKDNKSTITKIVRQDVTLKVYINRQGELKALGIEHLSDDISAFESDYSFQFKQVNFDVVDIAFGYDDEADKDYKYTITEGIIEAVEYRAVDIAWDGMFDIPDELKTYCNDNNISIIIDKDYSYITLIGNFAYSYKYNNDGSSELIIVSESSNKFAMRWNSESSDDDYINITTIETPPGFLYNLNYGHCKHSHLLNGIFHNTQNIIINADYIDDNYDILALPIHIFKGDIKNCIFKSDNDQPIEINSLYALDVDITFETIGDYIQDMTAYYSNINLYDRIGKSVTLTPESEM